MNIKSPKNIMCIYHKNCSDGFGAALVVYLWAKEHNQTVEFHSAHYGDTPPKAEGKDLLIVDFSYPRDVLLQLKEQANAIVVIDHHKTAQEALEGLDFCVFDMNKSGAMLTWEFLFIGEPAPLLLQYIQDRDLWHWELDLSKEVSAAIQSKPQDFELWESIINNKQDGINHLTIEGYAILNYQHRLIEKVIFTDIPLEDIAGYQVPCINTTHLISEIGHEISQGHPFAAMYFETASERIYSLRSADDGIDVSAIAKLFGGGGHFHAAGFKVKKPLISITPSPKAPR